MRQGAVLSFEGDLADPAEQAFAKFLSQLHDHKAAQLGDFIYSNSSVRLYCLPDNIQFTEVKKVLFEISLFYDAPEPPQVYMTNCYTCHPQRRPSSRVTSRTSFRVNCSLYTTGESKVKFRMPYFYLMCYFSTQRLFRWRPYVAIY